MKHLKHKSETPETLETRRRRRPWPTWWGTAVASKLWRMRTATATQPQALLCVLTPTLPGRGARGGAHYQDQEGDMGTDQQRLDDEMERCRIRIKDWARA